MFYFDLDELRQLHKKLHFFSLQRFNVFSFYPNDYLVWLPTANINAKEQVISYLAHMKVDVTAIEKVFLLTHARTFGHIFNPVSFYFCTDGENKPVVSVAFVTNTFKEMKPYIVPLDSHQKPLFKSRETKFFYVSPFLNHDSDFEFRLQMPHTRLQLNIDNYYNENVQFKSALSGKKMVLNDVQLLVNFISYPFITLQIITAIHWQAFCIWLKKINYFKKEAHPELQKNVLNLYHSFSHEHS